MRIDLCRRKDIGIFGSLVLPEEGDPFDTPHLITLSYNG